MPNLWVTTSPVVASSPAVFWSVHVFWIVKVGIWRRCDSVYNLRKISQSKCFLFCFVNANVIQVQSIEQSIVSSQHFSHTLKVFDYPRQLLHWVFRQNTLLHTVQPRWKMGTEMMRVIGMFHSPLAPNPKVLLWECNVHHQPRGYSVD